MSSLKEYYVSVLENVVKKRLGTNHCRPGVMVRHVNDKESLGTIIAREIDSNTALVLWSVEPKIPFTSFNFPPVRQVHQAPLAAPSLVGIQPMTAPAGGVFYLDFKYKLEHNHNASGQASVNVKARACIPQPPRSKVSQWHKQRNWKIRG